MKKDKLKELREAAKKLPDVYYNGFKTETVKGEDIIKAGRKEINGKAVIPDRMYKRSISVKVKANHLKAMKAAFTKGGDEDVKKYITKVFKQ